MKRAAILAALAIVVVASLLAAHDLFLIPEQYFLAPGAGTLVRVLNGTYEKSENAVSRDRLASLSLASGGRTVALPVSAWRENGARSELRLGTAAAGTYVLGASIRPNVLAMEGKAFNQYLTEEGITSVLEARRRAGALDARARERYSKHVKTIVQVGDARTADFATILGYPAEIVPVDQPYARVPGDLLRLRCLVDGKPVAGLTVIAGGAGTGASPTRIEPVSYTTSADGITTIRLTTAGRWYAKFVHMAPVRGGDVDYESQWATLTFEVRAASR
jgi:hypothetical protein